MRVAGLRLQTTPLRAARMVLSTSPPAHRAGPSGSSSTTHSSPFLARSTPLNLALLVLNVEPKVAPSRAAERFDQLWETSSVRVCADGAANRLHDSLAEPARARRLPDTIAGDLDSLRPAVAEYYASRGVAIEGEDGQDTHDFEKCLRWIERRHTSTAPALVGGLTVVAHGAFGGRLDQQMANLNMAYKATQPRGCFGGLEHLYLLCDHSIAFVLGPGRHVILPNADAEDGTCGLIPLGGRCEGVRTTGLRWDLDGSRPLEFGGLVSSSNEVVADRVTVETEAPLLWTAGLRR